MRHKQGKRNQQGTRHKQGAMQMWTILSALVIAVVLILFISMMVKVGVDKGKDDLSSRVDSLKDADDDGVVDLFDKCRDSTTAQVDSDGCTSEQKSKSAKPTSGQVRDVEKE